MGPRLMDANTTDLFVYIERRVGDGFIPERWRCLWGGVAEDHVTTCLPFSRQPTCPGFSRPSTLQALHQRIPSLVLPIFGCFPPQKLNRSSRRGPI